MVLSMRQSIHSADPTTLCKNVIPLLSSFVMHLDLVIVERVYYVLHEVLGKYCIVVLMKVGA